MLYQTPTSSQTFADRIEQVCEKVGPKSSSQRRLILQVLMESKDHPDAHTIVERTRRIDRHISVATVYRNLRIFEEAGVVLSHDFGNSRSRYELADNVPHEHLIDMTTGEVIEFVDDDFTAMRNRIAQRLGYGIISHRLELFGVAIDGAETAAAAE